MNQSETSKTNLYYAIGSLALLTFIGIMNETAMNVTYPELAQTFRITLDTTQWITSGYLLMVTIVMGTTAYLLRQFTARRLHLLAVTMFIVGSIICATSINFPILLIGRLIQAVATSLSTPLLFHLIFTQIPARQKGMMTGIAGMIISFAPALGPTYGGIVVQRLSWRMIFWLLLPFVVISLYLGQKHIHNHPLGNDKPFSYSALASLAAALVLAVTGIASIGHAGNFQACLITIGAAILMFLLFLFFNHHGRSQLLDLAIFRQLPIRLASLTYFNLQFINIGISLVIPVYAQYALGSGSMVAGLILLPGSFIGAFVAPFGGRWADQRSFAEPVITGAGLVALATLAFLLIQPRLTPALMAVLFIILRVGFNLAFSTTISNASLIVPSQNASDLNSAFNVIQQFAGSVGTGLLTAIIALHQNRGGTIVRQTFLGGRLDYYLLLFLALVTLVTVTINFHWQAHHKRG